MNRTAYLPIPFLLCAVMLLAGAMARDAAARTWVASPDGSSGDGTVAMILPQVQQADSLRLLSGDHEWIYPFYPPAMTVVGDAGARVVGEGVLFREIEFLSLSDVEFLALEQGMFITQVSSVRIENCVYRLCSASLSVTNCDVVNVLDTRVAENTTVGVFSAAGMVVAGGSIGIDRCVFRDNWGQAGAPYDETESGGGALRIGRDTDATVRACSFEGNEAGSGSAVHSLANSIVFEGNTVVGNRCESGAVVIHPISADPDATVIRQNIFAGNAAFGLWVGDSGFGVPRVYCNAFWQNNTILLGDFDERENHQWRAIVAQGYEGEADYHSTHADPMFCDSLVVHKESDLADQEHPCEPIGGARGFGCVVNPTRTTSWGSLKDRFGR